MKPLVLQGCGTALVTPFTPDGAVDYEAYARMVDRQVANGVHFLVPLATTGETPTLSAGEKTAIYQVFPPARRPPSTRWSRNTPRGCP